MEPLNDSLDRFDYKSHSMSTDLLSFYSELLDLVQHWHINL